MERKETYVGIDVAKAGMDIAVRPTDESCSDLVTRQGSDDLYPA